MKTIKKEKYMFHYFIACSVEVTCIVTVIILENSFRNIESAVFTYGEIGEEECAFSYVFWGHILYDMLFYIIDMLFKI